MATTKQQGQAQETATTRRPLYAELTTPAYEGWNDFADTYGCSLTSVLEAIGQALQGEDAWRHGHVHPKVLAILEHAREIGAERRRRKH